MPKIKIGEKVTAGEGTKSLNQVFKNGHKSFTVAEAKVLTETHHRERRQVDNFEAYKSKMLRPRNPLLGEPTPRELVGVQGEVVERTGELLFPVRPKSAVSTATTSAYQQLPLSSRYTARSTPRYSSRIYNDQIPELSDEAPNPLKRSDQTEERISSLQNMQDNISGELEFLRMKLLEKQRKLQGLNSRQQSRK